MKKALEYAEANSVIKNSTDNPTIVMISKKDLEQTILEAYLEGVDITLKTVLPV